MCSTAQSFIRKEVTSYKIHTLASLADRIQQPIPNFPDLFNDPIIFDEKQICWVKVAKSAIVRVQFGRTAM